MLSLYSYTVRNTFNFRGRASRKEYWTFTLLTSAAIGAAFAVQVMSSAIMPKLVALVSALVLILFLMIVNVSLTVRRLHDINLTGLWVLGMLIPVIIRITLAIVAKVQGEAPSELYEPIIEKISLFISLAFVAVALRKGDAGENRFGPVSTDGRDLETPTPEEYLEQIQRRNEDEAARAVSEPVEEKGN